MFGVKVAYLRKDRGKGTCWGWKGVEKNDGYDILQLVGNAISWVGEKMSPYPWGEAGSCRIWGHCIPVARCRQASERKGQCL